MGFRGLDCGIVKVLACIGERKFIHSLTAYRIMNENASCFAILIAISFNTCYCSVQEGLRMDVYDRIDQFINAKGLSRRKLAGLAGIAPQP